MQRRDPKVKMHFLIKIKARELTRKNIRKKKSRHKINKQISRKWSKSKSNPHNQ